ncbi:MAG: hypothetical protein QM723_02750 [Myxococcaceae bacterium]
MLPLLSLVSLACCGVNGRDGTGPADSGVSFSEVRNVIGPACSSEHGCHGSTAAYGADCYFDGGTAGFADRPLDYGPVVDLRNTVNVPSVYSAKLRVKPYAPDESFLMDKLEGHLTPCEGTVMPPGFGLTASEIALVRQWIAEGAPTQ